MTSEEEATSITLATIHSILFAIGFYLQIRTFLVAHKEKDSTWKLYISHGIVLLIYYPVCIFMQVAEHFLHPLSDFTGVWFCHVSSFLKYYGMVDMYSHSLAAAFFKYIFIVHREKVSKYGKAKVQKICFWLTHLLRILVCIRFYHPTLVHHHEEYAACFGTEGNSKGIAKGTNSTAFTEQRTFCRFDPLPPDVPFGSFINIATECFCVLESTVLLSTVCNLPEGLLYYKIFQHINRYINLLLAR